MTLTDYYKPHISSLFENNKTPRFDSIASNNSHPLFEKMAKRSKVKRCYYYSDDAHGSFNGDLKRRTDKAITNGKSNSSVYAPDLNVKGVAYRDLNDSQNEIIVVFRADYSEMEIFNASGYK